MKRAVIGIVAHVDSGKTTLSEAILKASGVIRAAGRVDHGNSFLDTDQVEKERGITIFMGSAAFERSGVSFTLLDTPGHVDFSPETERALRVLDAAVLVISGVDGVQSHTITLWRLLSHYEIPTIIFINKLDIAARSREDLIRELSDTFGSGFADFTGEALRAPTPDVSPAELLSPKNHALAEEIALAAEPLMEAFDAGKPFRVADIRAAVAERKLFPILSGSALKGSGVEQFLDLLAALTPIPDYTDKPFGAKVIRITEDGSDRLTHIKLTGGTLKVRDSVVTARGDGREITEKVSRIRLINGSKSQNINEMKPGMVAAVSGLTKTFAGQGLGAEQDSGEAKLEPVMSCSVILPEGTDIHTALDKFRKLEEEEPALNVTYDERKGNIRFGVMGEVQLEILKRVIHDRFGMDVEFGDGGIAYRETVAAPVLGIGHYEPLRHYAEVQLMIEPGERGSGVVYARDCDPEKLDPNFQRLVISCLGAKEHVGTLTGSPLTDVKITLVAGRAHKEHTEGGDFREAAWRAVRQGLRTAGCVLLEPWYAFTLEVPGECLGHAMSDITRFGGKFGSPENDGTTARITGRVPVAKLQGYHKEVAAYTKGRGRLTVEADGYEECHDEEVIASFGYDPDRDTANTADSIFCAHGAGFVVRWDEVPAHKHVDLGLGIDDEPEEELEDRAERFIRAAASDKELAAIFERTYGEGSFVVTSHDPRKRAAEKRVKRADPSKTPAAKRPQYNYSGKEYLLVDGYNIIFAWDELRETAKKSLDLARRRLIDRVANYQGFRGCEAIVVFDAYKVKENPGKFEKEGNLGIVYTKEAQTADAYIEKTAHDLSKTHRVRVATSDGAEQMIILGSGAIRVPAAAFHAEVCEAEKIIRGMLKF